MSLFDGISCGQLAFQRANIPVDKYFASEICDCSIRIAKKNFPNTIEIGDVRDVNGYEFKDIDILIGGSPCQSFSFAGKMQGMSTKEKQEITTLEQYLDLKQNGFEFEGYSYLFWEYVRILAEANPKYFLLENVKMSDKWKKVITNALGVEPILINSELVSAQSRERLYWTNIPFSVPNQRIVNTELKDILEDKDGTPVDDRFYICEGTVNYVFHRNDKWVSNPDKFKPNPQFSRPLVASGWKIHRADTEAYIQTEYKPVGRSNFRRLTPVEYERLQGLPDNYTFVDGYSVPQSNKQRWKCIGNGWQVDTITYIFKGLNLNHKIE